ncbi:MAG: bacteriophage Gp15 family protein [Coriobacteriia bacterium]|nr:bacteriophage Gp15 family protein [Coriobacteriia bacterium]
MTGPVSPLLGALPDSVEAGGVTIPIRTDFRCGIRFEELLFAKGIPDQTRVSLALGIWFETVPQVDMQALVDAMLGFYRCGKQPVSGGSTAQVYSYEHDYDLIFSGFMSAYRIDLMDPALSLHWWRFRALMWSLPDDSTFKTAVGWRSARPESGMGKEAKAHMRKMQKAWALPREHASTRFSDEADFKAWLTDRRRETELVGGGRDVTG